MRVFVPGNFISSYQVAGKEMAVNWMSYLEKLSKGKRDMVNRCLEGRVFFFSGYGNTDRSIWQSYVGIHEPTFPLPWELAVMAGETCSTVVAKWQIVSTTGGRGNGDKCWIPMQQEPAIAAICRWLWRARDRWQNLPVYFFCLCLHSAQRSLSDSTDKSIISSWHWVTWHQALWQR